MFSTQSCIIVYTLAHLALGQIVSGYGTTKPLTPKPNIIIFVADDMGFNDVSFHGSDQILTPNIDALAYNGIILNKHYTPVLCTPSRAALLTGRYPINTGMQHYVIPNDEPWGLPLNETLMPEILRKEGYSTYIVGKWHLGFHKVAYTPTRRGFDYHYGYYGGYIDYYQHYLEMIGKPYAKGNDMRRNLEPIVNQTTGIYATDLFTDEAVNVIHQHDQRKPMFLYLPHLAPHAGNEDKPMQAPPEEIAKFAHIKDPQRRTYAAMVSKLDASIGRVMEALYTTQMLHNSVVLFYSDNGGPTAGMHGNAASNFPFRGQKHSPWEGGMRTSAAIWSPYLMSQHQTVANTLIHVTDWFPTILGAAGIEIPAKLNLDGRNIWNQLQNGYSSPRWNIIHNIDDIIGYSSYSTRRWKYVNGTTSDDFNGWLGTIANETDPRASNYTGLVLNSVVNQVIKKISAEIYLQDITESSINRLRKLAIIQCPTMNGTYPECKPKVSPCLFDIEADPCERYNLALHYPQELGPLESDIEFFRKKAVKSVRVPADPKCDPRLYNSTWTWWQDRGSGATSNMLSNRIFGNLAILAFVVSSICVLF